MIPKRLIYRVDEQEPHHYDVSTLQRVESLDTTGLSERLEESRVHLAQQKETLRKARRKLPKLKSERAELLEKLSQLNEADATKAAEIAEVNAKIAELDAQISEKTELFQRIEEALQELEATLKQLEEKLAELRTRHDELEAEQGSLVLKMEKLERKKDLMESSVKMMSNMAKTFETLDLSYLELTDSLQSTFDEMAPTAQSLKGQFDERLKSLNEDFLRVSQELETAKSLLQEIDLRIGEHQRSLSEKAAAKSAKVQQSEDLSADLETVTAARKEQGAREQAIAAEQESIRTQIGSTTERAQTVQQTEIGHYEEVRSSLGELRDFYDEMEQMQSLLSKLTEGVKRIGKLTPEQLKQFETQFNTFYATALNFVWTTLMTHDVEPSNSTLEALRDLLLKKGEVDPQLAKPLHIDPEAPQQSLSQFLETFSLEDMMIDAESHLSDASDKKGFLRLARQLKAADAQHRKEVFGQFLRKHGDVTTTRISEYTKPLADIRAEIKKALIELMIIFTDDEIKGVDLGILENTLEDDKTLTGSILSSDGEILHQFQILKDGSQYSIRIDDQEAIDLQYDNPLEKLFAEAIGTEIERLKTSPQAASSMPVVEWDYDFTQTS